MTSPLSSLPDTGIYLDYNATTPVDPRVFAKMEPYFKEIFGNPASAGHHWGWAAENAAQKARVQVSSLIGAKPSEITFTAGATESNNTVIFGLISKLCEENPYEKIHVITSCIEHSSVMNSFAAARKLDVEVDFLPVNHFGQVDIETVRKALKPHTKLMSFIWVNNEIGSINPISQLAKFAKENKIYFHTDATQAVGKIPVNVTDMGIDMLSFSAHKMYGPKGVGVLYLRSKDPKVQINPLIYGGGQEKGLRSGTLNVPAIVGLGAAAEICEQDLILETGRTLTLRKILWRELQVAIPGIRLNGHPEERSPINLSITLPGIKTDSVTGKLQKLAVSTGSACFTGTMSISHVLEGIGLTADEAQCTFRLSLGRWTSEDEIHRAVALLKSAIPT